MILQCLVEVGKDQHIKTQANMVDQANHKFSFILIRRTNTLMQSHKHILIIRKKEYFHKPFVLGRDLLIIFSSPRIKRISYQLLRLLIDVHCNKGFFFITIRHRSMLRTTPPKQFLKLIYASCHLVLITLIFYKLHFKVQQQITSLVKCSKPMNSLLQNQHKLKMASMPN